MSGVVLLAIAFCVSTLTYRSHPANFLAEQLHTLFDLNGEANVPAWYSTLLWLLAARAAWKLGDVEALEGKFLGGRAYWRILAGVAVFLSLDESAAWHEKIGLTLTYLRNGSPEVFFSISGIKVFAWTAYGAVIASVVGFIFIPLLFKLDKITLFLLLLSGAMFIFGSLIMESIGPIFWSQGLYFPQRMEELIEETSEMVGVIFLIATLERRRRLCVERRGTAHNVRGLSVVDDVRLRA